jgi:hypothetical protein
LQLRSFLPLNEIKHSKLKGNSTKSVPIFISSKRESLIILENENNNKIFKDAVYFFPIFHFLWLRDYLSWLLFAFEIIFFPFDHVTANNTASLISQASQAGGDYLH